LAFLQQLEVQSRGFEVKHLIDGEGGVLRDELLELAAQDLFQGLRGGGVLGMRSWGQRHTLKILAFYY
jgi:hypothetical protein